MNTTRTEENKAIVTRFNREVIEQGDMSAFKALVGDNVINHAAPAGTPAGHESMRYFLFDVLRKGFSGIQVEILDQVAEGDKVTTRKIIKATHTGEFMGVPATGKNVDIHVIDIIRVQDGSYADHWGMSNIGELVRVLAAG